MSVALTINGSTYEYPETGDQEWGPDATDWAVAVTSGMLQKAGGLFQLLADADFGTAFGLKSLYYKSRTANVATAGSIRLAVSDTINFRNNANDANLPLGINGSNQLTFDGVALALSPFSVSDTDSINLTLNVNDVSADLNLSSDTADPSTQLVDFSIESDGLKGQITNAAITSAIPIADTDTTGLLSDTDWNTFNGKQSTISISGAGPGAGNINAVVTLIANVLRTQVPILIGDSGAGGTAGVVPAPSAGDSAANKFLAANGTWKQSGSSVRTVSTQAGPAYTLQLSDGSGSGNNPVLILSNASDIIATIPANATIAFPVGTQIDVLRGNTGSVQFEPAVGVTLNGFDNATSISAPYGMGSLIKTATNTWDLFGNVASYIVATGGTITTDGNYKIHTFTSSGTLAISAGSGAIESLVVAGGGGGGNSSAGGGGGGGVVHTTPGATYGVGSYTVTVGAGGAGSAGGVQGVNGSNSAFDTITATGGGGGGHNGTAGSAGGSGGGGGSGQAGGSGAAGQGFAGGSGFSGAGTDSGGGGGGASALGSNGANSTGGNGGAGVSKSISGAAVTYGGGGGGGTTGATQGTGGAGGGANGANNAANNGTANTGGGGGGRGDGLGSAGTGGSGIVIVRYRYR